MTFFHPRLHGKVEDGFTLLGGWVHFQQPVEDLHYIEGLPLRSGKYGREVNNYLSLCWSQTTIRAPLDVSLNGSEGGETQASQ